ncbi:hypothetical protein AB0K23_39190 [Streptomyces sp. NPDC049602]|uniref:hypothetical protein n=1 Tax=Streptomyces sp. NPDC049602 TaxID=3155504 RepID=UPI0034439E29
MAVLLKYVLAERPGSGGGVLDTARQTGGKHRNLNLLGRYSFTVSTPADGALRPPRDPDAPELDEVRRRRGPNAHIG